MQQKLAWLANLHCMQVHDATLRKVKALEEARESSETERDTLRAVVMSLERDVSLARHETDLERRKLADLMHERDVLNKLRTQVNVALGMPAARSTRGKVHMCNTQMFCCFSSSAAAGTQCYVHSMPCLASPSDAMVRIPMQADSATQKQVELVRMTEGTKRNLEQEVASYRCGA